MRVSYEWLSEYVDLAGISASDLARELTRTGIEVDRVYSRDTGIRDVVVGDVLEVAPHPNADKLQVCEVDLGAGDPVSIVCGAPNVRAGQRVPVAKVGAVLPGLKIKKAKLRGVQSEGMICSAQEMGLDEKMLSKAQAEGILVLPEESAIGTDVRTVLGLTDEVMELDLTPNRSDCLSMIGVAYEVAAVCERELTLPPQSEFRGRSELPGSVKLEAGHDCPLYALQIVKDIHIGPSPAWMQNRLISAGIRPINNIVDITNYIMLEYGQPLHAFDYTHIHNGDIVVRNAKEGEMFVTLDGVTRRLDESMTLITDGTKPVALAGVMGGENSEISPETRTVLIESAYFDPLSVSRTSRKLGLRSEASARFEKNADPARVLPALRRATELMCELADGVRASDEIFAQEHVREAITVKMRYDRLNSLLGTRITPAEAQHVFDRLQFKYEDQGDSLSVRVPTRRPDIDLEVDLIEEVARLYGYDHIPATLPKGARAAGALTREQDLTRDLHLTLRGLGLSEAVTYAFTSPETDGEVASLNPGVTPIPLQMPMSEARSTLRTGLLPGLLEAAEHNIHHRQERVALYEIGRTFAANGQPLRELPQEDEECAGLICGSFGEPDWLDQNKPLDFFAVKGVLNAIFHRLGIVEPDYRPTDAKGFHPGRSAALYLEGDLFIGIVGQLHPNVAANHDLPESYAFELKLAPLLQMAKGEDIRYEALPRYPAVNRDLAIVVDHDIPVAELTKTIQNTAVDVLESVMVFDVFAGAQLGDDKKSVAFSLVYRHPERTLTDEEIHDHHRYIVDQLRQDHGAELR